MIVRIKLYAMLAKYLPANAVKNEADLSVDDEANVEAVLLKLNLPLVDCHLVLVNGVYLSPSERPEHLLQAGDHLAVWPPVAGG